MRHVLQRKHRSDADGVARRFDLRPCRPMTLGRWYEREVSCIRGWLHAEHGCPVVHAVHYRRITAARGTLLRLWSVQQPGRQRWTCTDNRRQRESVHNKQTNEQASNLKQPAPRWSYGSRASDRGLAATAKDARVFSTRPSSDVPGLILNTRRHDSTAKPCRV